MRITLEGFRTYKEKKTIEFTDKDVTLIEGTSGQGKTTLFRAINWALYGKEKSTYPWSSSKKKCYVQLDLESCSILRQKNPERLTVTLLPEKKELSSEEAQTWIIKQWGTRESWIATSYLIQDTRNILIQGSMQEKLSLLEEWAFPEDSPAEWIEKLSKEKKKYQQIMDSKASIVDLYKSKALSNRSCIYIYLKKYLNNQLENYEFCKYIK